jgi:preprotein translocase subunit SecA
MLVARARNLLSKIKACSEGLDEQTDAELRKSCLSLRYRAKSGESLDRLLPECFALVREAADRRIGMRHFDVQIIGGTLMHHRSIVEMQTGEGKTLTATLPSILSALPGRGAHIATVNDYLARRDAEWMRPIYECLGLSVGVVETDMTQEQRRIAYRCDVTYGTAKEFGFDFLRDRLLKRRIGQEPSHMLGMMLGQVANKSNEEPVQREPHFALVDEADSILIDEARTPLIISAAATAEQKAAVEAYRWAAKVVPEFEDDEHYEYDHEKKTVELTLEGRRLVRDLPHPEALNDVGMVSIYEYVERAIKVSREFFLDRQYVVRDGEIVIVDEFTGRLSEGRKWRAGIHQAVEAKEGVEVTVETGQAARVTVQDYFRRYRQLCGMSGTVTSSRRELKKIYRLSVLAVPTNKPNIREELTASTFADSDTKWAAIVTEIRTLHTEGRPVLVGTRTIDKSELLSARLTEAGIEHHVLNAHHIAAEAEIVAQAGCRGAVTIATNMAGRGTDIILGGNAEEKAWSQLQQKFKTRLDVPREEWTAMVRTIQEERNFDSQQQEICRLGGLHVICSEWHESARIDRQLIGRCGRQGDPGTYRRYAALDDEIIATGYGPRRAEKIASRGNGRSDSIGDLSGQFRRAQQRVEKRHFQGRKSLMYHEKLRKKIQIQMGQDPYLDTPN